jgi:hypothetical protein
LPAHRVDVDNVFGSIHVVAGDVNDIRVTAVETIHADSPERMAEAHRDVKLDITQDGDLAKLYVDGPFRDNCRDGWRGAHNDRRPGYEVKYDFEIQVPRGAGVVLSTVNDGDIHVDGTVGDFDVNNVNGGIELKAVEGSGRAHTVNGPVRVVFLKNPRQDSSFASINGTIDLAFPPSLNAVLRIKTFNGPVYSDFDMTTLPVRNVSAETSGGMHKFKSDKFTSLQVGSGGPEIKIDGFNGEIRIRHAK